MLYLTVFTPVFIFILIFCCLLSFVAGCIWMASGKNNKDAEDEAKKKTGEVIDIERSIIQDNWYTWDKEKAN